jgi:RNA polymerase sigma-70 factor, ECF subfamily
MNLSEPTAHEITRRLCEWSGGDREALEKLLPLVYDELHRQAANYMRRERADHTLQTTALINEAYLRLVDQREVNWESRRHFFAIASQSMRRILVDYAKAKSREKRGGGGFRITLDEAALGVTEAKSIDLIALDEALDRLYIKDKQQARVVELRYFSGLNLEKTAEVLKISRTTAARDWAMAKAWLHRELTK